jgi:DNA-binding response OmpR family regulator
MRRHVLLIEDEPNISEAIRFILGRDGIDVSCHSQGHDAIEMILAHRPDAVILDVMLPGRSGFDILRDLRAEAQTVDLPILMLTAKGQSRDRELALQAGATGFIAKPFSNAEMLASVKSLLVRA